MWGEGVWQGEGIEGGEGVGEGVGGGGRGHFIHLAIYCTATWCFALKGLRTMKGDIASAVAPNTASLVHVNVPFVTQIYILFQLGWFVSSQFQSD